LKLAWEANNFFCLAEEVLLFTINENYIYSYINGIYCIFISVDQFVIFGEHALKMNGKFFIPCNLLTGRIILSPGPYNAPWVNTLTSLPDRDSTQNNKEGLSCMISFDILLFVLKFVTISHVSSYSFSYMW
jgi:hypothetical protein